MGLIRPYSAYVPIDKYIYLMRGNTDIITNGFYNTSKAVNNIASAMNFKG
jgi:hypothetical protein